MKSHQNNFLTILGSILAISLALAGNPSKAVYFPDQDTPVIKVSYEPQSKIIFYSTQQDDLFDYAFLEVGENARYRYEVAKHEIGDLSEIVELLRMDEEGVTSPWFLPTRIQLKIPVRDPASGHRPNALLTLTVATSEKVQRTGKVEAGTEFR